MPKCLAAAANASCIRAVASPAECPTDGIMEATAGTLKCADLRNCRQCLRFAGQCKWCVSGAPDGFSGCQSGAAPCSAWFGAASRECPADGDPLAGSWSAAPCSAYTSCSDCLAYGGRTPQCVWCGGTCMHAASSEGRACQRSGKPVWFAGKQQCDIAEPAGEQASLLALAWC